MLLNAVLFFVFSLKYVNETINVTEGANEPNKASYSQMTFLVKSIYE